MWQQNDVFFNFFCPVYVVLFSCFFLASSGRVFYLKWLDSLTSIHKSYIRLQIFFVNDNFRLVNIEDGDNNTAQSCSVLTAGLCCASGRTMSLSVPSFFPWTIVDFSRFSQETWFKRKEEICKFSSGCTGC